METFLELIKNYGVVAVIIALLCYIVKDAYSSWKQRIEKRDNAKLEADRRKQEDDRERERTEREDKRYEKICDAMNGLSGRIGGSVAHTTKEQADDVKLYGLVQTELDRLVDNGAQHSYFFLFHNGGNNILGQGMLKMTVQVESSADGKSRLSSWQAVPRSMMQRLYEKLVEYGDYYIGDVEKIVDDDVKTYAFLKESHSKSAFFKAVKRSDGLVIGFVGAEYKDTKEVFDNEKKEISHVADRVAGAFLMNEENKRD